MAAKRKVPSVTEQSELELLRTELERLAAERDEAFAQQQATAEVLGAINANPGELAPVWAVMLEKATRLCEAQTAHLLRFDGIAFSRAASLGIEPEFDRLLPLNTPLPHAITQDSVPYRLLQSQSTIHVHDLRDDESVRAGAPAETAAVEQHGARTVLFVPLLREGAVAGCFVLHRLVVRPFSDKQIALVENFAAQAVTAMENARLLAATREALAQQTATAEVLQIINSSPGDLAPVFNAMLEKAIRLCDAVSGHFRTYDGNGFPLAAVRGEPEHIEAMRRSGPLAPGPHHPVSRFLRGEDLIHMPNATESEEYRDDARFRSLVDLGVLSLLSIALRKDGHLLGYINVYRHVAEPFTDRQIALLQNFAAQAVIAMENARLLTETQEALDQQTATAEVLQVINSSPGDLTPVFDAMLEKANYLCETALGILWTFDGTNYHPGAIRGPQAFIDAMKDKPRVPGIGGTLYLHAAGETLVHIEDMAADAELYEASATRRAFVDLAGARSSLSVSLRKDGALLGALQVYRQEVRPFTDKQIALLQNFAAQAVIAMENARLLTETQQRTAELQESLEYQTATSDVLKAISRSAIDLDAVLGTVVSAAVQLCRGEYGVIFRNDGSGEYRFAAGYGNSPEYEERERQAVIRPGRGTIVGRAALEGRAVQIADALSDPDYEDKESTRLDDVHSMLGVPLMRDGQVVGAFGLARSRVEPFSEREVELVTIFADQAVIAIENARLLGELRQRQAELRVTFDNMADGVAMFDQELRLAAWNKNFRDLLDLPEEFFAVPQSYDGFIHYLGERGEYGDLDPRAEIARLHAEFGDHFRFERTRPDGTVIEVRHNPMPDGGFVLIYSDITERKRSEEEIREARDAAEAAYADLKAAQANLIQAEKMASLGQLTAGIAHEIKNPLNFINNFASLSVELLDELKATTAPALATLDEDERADVDDTMELLTGNLEKIAEHGKRADNIVKSMLEHSRGVSGERRDVDLNGIIEEALNLAYHGARAQDQSFNITLERDYAQSLKPIELAPQEMTRVFLNLFGNGFYAAHKRARDDGDDLYRPTLTVTTGDTGDAVEVRVRDNGIGIPPEIRDKLFQPFFTTKPTGEGTGLGLSISYDIVTQQHGGTITVESEEGAYTEFTVRLPRR